MNHRRGGEPRSTSPMRGVPSMLVDPIAECLPQKATQVLGCSHSLKTTSLGYSSVRIEGDDDQEMHEELKGCGSDADALTMDVREMQYLYKNQLQIYTQKKNLNLPTYKYVREGSLHAPRFKASVTVDGQTYESPQYFGILKDAEHSAAKVALMSFSAVGNHEVEDYKLQGGALFSFSK